MKLQFRVKHLLIFNLYVAYILAAVFWCYRSAGPLPFLFFPTLLQPAILVTGVSPMYMMNPGAGRDFAMWLCLSLFWLCAAVQATLTSTYAILRVFTGPFGSVAREGVGVWNALLMLAIFPLIFWAAFLFITYQWFPTVCPVCKKRGLIRAGNSHKKSPQSFSFYWCFACGVRCKRSRIAPFAWEATAPEEEQEHYHLTTGRSRLKAMLEWFKYRPAKPRTNKLSGAEQNEPHSCR